MKFVLLKKRTLISFVLLIVALVLALTATGVSGSAAVWQGKTTRKIPIYNVQTDDNKVAISFDASWGAEKTPYILKTLQAYNVRATFFAVGFWAEKYSEQLKELSESGVMEIGTHSNTHPDMSKLNAQQIKLELETSVNIIQNITGKKVELFRAPFGSYSNTLLDTASDMGLYTIQWDVDSLDWKGLKAAEMANRILNKVKKGSIILMHNDGEHTVAALPAIIEGIKNKGLEFVPIGELIYKDGYTIDHTGKQIKQ